MQMYFGVHVFPSTSTGVTCKSGRLFRERAKDFFCFFLFCFAQMVNGPSRHFLVKKTFFSFLALSLNYLQTIVNENIHNKFLKLSQNIF